MKQLLRLPESVSRIIGEAAATLPESVGIVLSTKYLYIKSTTVYVLSLEMGLPHPFSRKRVCPPPGPKGGGAHSPTAKGVGESQFQRLEKRLALSLLCGPKVKQLLICLALCLLCGPKVRQLLIFPEP